MDIWRWILGASLTGAILWLGYLLENTKKLKEKIKENSYLENENNELKKIIFNLAEDKKFLMEGIMEFKDGGITKDDLIKYNQSLINKAKEGIEKRRLEKIQNRIKLSEIFGIDVTEQKKAKEKERTN